MRSTLLFVFLGVSLSSNANAGIWDFWSSQSEAPASKSKSKIKFDSDLAANLWKEAAKFNIRKSGNYGLLLQMAYANQKYKEQGKRLDPKALLSELNNIDKQYQKDLDVSRGRGNYSPFNGPGREAAVTFVKSAKKIEDLRVKDIVEAGSKKIGKLGKWLGIADLGDDVIKIFGAGYNHFHSEMDQQTAQMKILDSERRFEKLGDKVLTELLDNMVLEPGFAALLNVKLQGTISTNFQNGDSDSILNDPINHEFSNSYTNSGVRAYFAQLKREGRSQFTKEETKEMMEKFATEFRAQNEAALEEIGKLSEFVRNREKHQAEIEEMRMRIEVADHQLRGTEASFQLLSLAIGNPDTRKRFTAFGSAAVSITGSVLKFSHDLASKTLEGGLNRFFSGAIMTGNIAGAVTGLIGSFIGGPSAEELILQDLGEVKQMIATVGNMIQDFANQLDEKLNSITKHLDSRFDYVDERLHDILKVSKIQTDMLVELIEQGEVTHENLNKIQKTLDTAVEDINRLNSNMVGHFSSLVDYMHKAKIKYCFNWSSMNPDKPLGASEFTRCLTEIEAYTEDQPRISMVPEGTPSSDPDKIYETLGLFTLDKSTKYLVKVAQTFFHQKVDDTFVVNPMKWVVGVDSLLYMLVNYRENASDLGTIYLYGDKDIPGILEKLMVQGKMFVSGIGSLKTKEFFDLLLTEYTDPITEIEKDPIIWELWNEASKNCKLANKGKVLVALNGDLAKRVSDRYSQKGRHLKEQFKKLNLMRRLLDSYMNLVLPETLIHYPRLKELMNSLPSGSYLEGMITDIMDGTFESTRCKLRSHTEIRHNLMKLQMGLHEALAEHPGVEIDPAVRNTLVNLKLYYESHYPEHLRENSWNSNSDGRDEL